jgi:dTDP-4-dehydrorhamnose reductase
MRLLIAGWQGQVARALVEAAPSRPEISALAVGRPALDLVDPGSVARTVGDVRPDIVINSAAYTAVDKAESEPDAAHALNAEGARVLAEAAAKRGAAIIHISTDYVFDGQKPAPYTEDDPTGPMSIYGRSKLAGEDAVRRANPRHVIVRTSWVHSATGQNFTKTMLRLGAERPELQVVDDQTGSPTYAPHLADALLAMAHLIASAPRPEHFGTFHAAGTGTTTWCGLAREIFKVAATHGATIPVVTPITTAEYPTPARRPANSRFDCSKLARVYGITLPAWREGVAECVEKLLRKGV